MRHHTGRLENLEWFEEQQKLLFQRISAHNQLSNAWGKKGHRHHFSALGRAEYVQLLETTRALERENRKLGQKKAEIFAETEGLVWKLVDDFTALHELFCIAHAYWHRGFTAGKRVDSSRISEPSDNSADFFQQPQTEQTDLVLDTEGTSVANRNSLRMLFQAYEWHSLRENPLCKKDDFPILVICDARRLGVEPDTEIYLDTFDMRVSINGKSIQLSEGKLTGDDELFWMTQFLPRVVDSSGSIKDLRFYPRKSLAIQ